MLIAIGIILAIGIYVVLRVFSYEKYENFDADRQKFEADEVVKVSDDPSTWIADKYDGPKINDRSSIDEYPKFIQAKKLTKEEEKEFWKTWGNIPPDDFYLTDSIKQPYFIPENQPLLDAYGFPVDPSPSFPDKSNPSIEMHVGDSEKGIPADWLDEDEQKGHVFDVHKLKQGLEYLDEIPRPTMMDFPYPEGYPQDPNSVYTHKAEESIENVLIKGYDSIPKTEEYKEWINDNTQILPDATIQETPTMEGMEEQKGDE